LPLFDIPLDGGGVHVDSLHVAEFLLQKLDTPFGPQQTFFAVDLVVGNVVIEQFTKRHFLETNPRQFPLRDLPFSNPQRPFGHLEFVAAGGLDIGLAVPVILDPIVFSSPVNASH